MQILKKFIGNDQVDGEKIELANNQPLMAKTALGSDVELIKLDTTNKIVFSSVPFASGVQIATVNDIPTVTVVWNKESTTLTLTDIANQYVDLSQVIIASSLDVLVGGVVQREGVDYFVTLTGGELGTTRVSFLGDLATGGVSALVDSDVLYFKYQV